MVYLLWPTDFAAIDMDSSDCSRSGEKYPYIVNNKPIPAELFPKWLNIEFPQNMTVELPDLFRVGSSFIFPERARAVMEELAPGQVEYIPVAISAEPEFAERLNLASAYYHINVLGRAQRLQWLESATQKPHPQKDGTVIVTLWPRMRDWKMTERAEGEPLIWRESDWRSGNRIHRDHSHVFVEDVLWQALNANFPDQLSKQRVGK
jgi:hypothetical protein